MADPYPVETLKEASEMGLLTVLQVKAGENHALTLVQMTTEECDRKCVFVWGANDRRQLGIDEDVEEIRMPH